MSNDAHTLGRLARRRAQWAVRRGLGRYHTALARYRTASASADPGDVAGLLYSLSLWRRAHAALSRTAAPARLLSAHDSVLLEPAGALTRAAEELLEERRWISHAARGYRGDDLQRVREALDATMPRLALEDPVMAGVGQSAFDFLFPGT